MPFRYSDAQDQIALMARIVERVLATGSLEAACREPGMPHHETVRRWAIANTAFHDQLKMARKRGWYRRKWAFDEAQAKRVLAHLRAGGTLRRLPTGPAWPTVRMVQYWRATDGEFAAELLRAQAMSRAVRNAGRSPGRRPTAFDPAVADRVILAVARGARLDRLQKRDASLPGRGLIRRWRREVEDFDLGLSVAIRVSQAARRREPVGLTPDLRREIVAHIREGGSLSSFGDRPDAPGKSTLYAWIGRNEGFARAVMAACDDRELWWTDVIGEALEDTASLGAKARRARLAPLNKQWARHQNRPGRKWR